MADANGKPLYLYKYRSLNPLTGAREHTLDILKNNRLYLSPPKDFNDPFDCKLPVDWSGLDLDKILNANLKGMEDALGKDVVDGARKQIYEKHPSYNDELLKEGEKAIYAEYDKIGITSFSGVGKRKDMLMWAHYANNHSGICLVFIDEAPIGRILIDVEYVETPPKIKIIGATGEDMKKALTTKAKFWEYEDEYRVVALGQAGTTLSFQLPSLVGVQFGLRTLEADKKEILEILRQKKYPGVGIYQMSKSQDKFELIETEIGEVNHWKEYYAEKEK